MRLTFFQEEHDVSSLEQLRQLLQLRYKGQYAAFWLSGEQGSSLALCINGGDAWLYFFRFDGDSGAYSMGHDPSPDDETASFLIDNY